MVVGSLQNSPFHLNKRIRRTTHSAAIHHLSSQSDLNSQNPFLSLSKMDSTKLTSELAIDIPPFIRVYKDGRVERLMGTETVPPSFDPATGVESKDFVISPETGLSVRIYIPKTAKNNQPDKKKLPLLIYYHGGAFVIETAVSPQYHNYVNSVVDQANVVAVSVDYRRAPEHPLPIAYDDSWTALQWVASHFKNEGPEVWLNDHADLQRIFLAGDSAGANIAHNMAMRAGLEELVGDVKLEGIVLVHPYFWGKESIGNEVTEKKDVVDKLWLFVSPGSSAGCDDPFINPTIAPTKLSSLGCTKVLVCVAEKDLLRDRGWSYYEALKKCGWDGVVEIMEEQGVDHVFHLFDPTSDNSSKLMRKFVSFMK